MKTIVEINSNNYASTGNIMLNIASYARKNGYNVYTCCKKSRKAMTFDYPNQIFIGTWIERIVSERLSYITGLKSHFNIINTFLFINKLKKIKPDLIHIHSLVDTYINIRILTNYIKKNNIPTVWTAHDVWTITGKCVIFEPDKPCDNWKNGCGKCPTLKSYPKSLFFDTTKLLFKQKVKCFNPIKNLYIVTPSNWLSNLVNQSFLKNHPCKTIYNGIDIKKFRPTESDFRQRNNLENSYIVLGVSYGWSHTKGLDSFIELAKLLPKKYQIVLVGTNDEVDKKLPNNILSIHKTYDVEELISIYSAADVFVNASLSDNFPTVNLEALACGTPIITYETGGSPEAINNTCGSSVKQGDIISLKEEIIRVCKTKPYTQKNCLERAKQFDMNNKYQEYVELFNKILKD